VFPGKHHGSSACIYEKEALAENKGIGRLEIANFAFTISYTANKIKPNLNEESINAFPVAAQFPEHDGPEQNLAAEI
jgi:hypothetical protein